MRKVLSNIQVSGLAESIYRSGYSMMAEAPSQETFRKEVLNIIDSIQLYKLTKHSSNRHIKRAIALAKKGGGEDQFLTGIRVSFDLSFTIKAWVEAERYKFLDFVTSQSTIHRINKMDIRSCCVEEVDPRIIDILQEKIDTYNNDKTRENFLKIAYNIPTGLILTAGMDTNYRCLKNMCAQRDGHMIEDWRLFCEEVKQLPMAKELIFGDKGDWENEVHVNVQKPWFDDWSRAI